MQGLSWRVLTWNEALVTDRTGIIHVLAEGGNRESHTDAHREEYPVCMSIVLEVTNQD